MKDCPSPLARFPHRHEAALGHPPTGPHEPQAHGLRLVGSGGTLRPVLQQHRSLRSEPPVLPIIDGHPMGVRDDQAGVRQPALWELLAATCTASRSGTCSASSTLRYCRKRKILSSLRRFSVSSCTQPPRQVVQQLGLLQRPQHRGPAEGVLHRRQLSKVPEQQKPDSAVRGERDLLDDQPSPASSAPRGWSSAPSGPPSAPPNRDSARCSASWTSG